MLQWGRGEDSGAEGEVSAAESFESNRDNASEFEGVSARGAKGALKLGAFVGSAGLTQTPGALGSFDALTPNSERVLMRMSSRVWT